MNWKKRTEKVEKENSYYGDQSPSFRNREPKKDFRYQNGPNTGDSGSGEMVYYDPNDEQFRRHQGMSPVTSGRQELTRSPIRYVMGQSVLSTVRNDINDRPDTSQVGKKPIPSVKVNLPTKYQERLERSPKTINLGETDREMEYNIKTLQGRRSPKTSNIDTGNIFLDLPMQSNSFIQNDQVNFQSPTEQKGSSGFFQGMNSREVQYTMDPRDSQSMQITMKKMSPKQNMEDENSSDNKDNDSNIREYKTQTQNIYNKDSLAMQNVDDGMGEGTHATKNTLEQVEKYIKSKEERNTLTDVEIKKIVKQFTNGYDPRKGNQGTLINTNQTVLLKGNDEIFNDRYRVLQKMNKLSTILLSKNKATNDALNSSSIDESRRTFERKTFDRRTLNASTLGNKDRKIPITKTPQQKFLFISLAMLSSKGPYCEDRLMLRKMRNGEIGGVVDLAQDQKTKTKFKVKKIQRKKPPIGTKQTLLYNPKHRDKAAKIVQGWWRDMKNRYGKILDKIVLIQSIWRGRWLRKYIYDIIYISYLHQRFCDILEKVMVSHIRPQVFEKLFGQKKNAREALGMLLLKDKRWSMLGLKPYFDKWRDTAEFLKTRNFKSKNLVNLRELNEEKKKELSKYFKNWVLRANLAKYIGKAKDAEAKKQQFFGVLKMMSGSTQLAKRTGLETINPALQRFLMNRLKSRIIRKLLMKKPKYSILFVRKYFNRWNSNVLKLTMKDLREEIFSRITTRLHGRIMLNNIRRNFNNWRNKLPKNKETLYARGKDLLEMFAHRRTHKDPVKALKEKEDFLNTRDHLLRMLGVKSRYIRQNWRDYIYTWRFQVQKLKDKNIKNKMYNSLLNTVLNKRRNRILSNRFSHWRKTPKLDLDALFNKFKGFIYGTEKLCQQALYPTRKDFMGKLNKTISSNAYNRALQIFLERYINRGRTYLRYYMYKWREQCKNYEIYDLKVQLFRYLCGVKETKSRKGRLSKAFNHWKMNVRSDRLLNKANNNYQANQGLDMLNTLYRRKLMDFMIRMHKKMDKDYRPKYIESIATRLFKPRGTLRDCISKWRRVNDIEKGDEKVTNLKGQILKTNAHRLFDRVNRDSIIKAFFKWLNQCRNPEDYYPKISDGINKVDHFMKKNNLTYPFELLKVTKNYARRIIPLLKNRKNLQERLDKDSVRAKFAKWINSVSNNRILDLKTNFILKTKNNVMSSNKGKQLTRYFTKWKMYRPKGMNAGFFKGLELLRNFCEKPYRKPVFEAFKDKLGEILKKRGLNTLFGASQTYTNHLLQNTFKKWWLNAKLTDPNKDNRIKTRLRLHLKDKEQKPLDKYFKRWLRALVKNPNFVQIIEASDILKSHFIKRNSAGFDLIRNKISKNFINSKIIKNILPNSKLAKERALRSVFDKWLSNTNKINTKALKGGLLSQVYSKGRGAVRNRIMRSRFKKWATKEPERKPIDLYSAIQGNDIINTMFANKYLKGFLPNMKEYGTNKFLRNLLLKTSIFHLRIIKPYFNTWKTKGIKLREKSITQDVSSRLMAQSKTHQTNAKTIKLLTNKLSHWRLNARNETKKLENVIPDALKYLKLFNTNRNVRPLLDGMNSIVFETKKKNALRALPSKRAKCDKVILKQYFDRYKNRIQKAIYSEMKDFIKRKCLTQIIKRMSGGLLRYFLIWRNKSQIKHSETPITMGTNLLRLAILRQPYRHFVKIADMLNLQIPRGLGLKKALVDRKVNIAKSIALRNISMRPSWNQWKRQANALKNKSINRHIFNKIISDKLRKGDTLQLRRAFGQWKDQTNRLINKGKLKELQMKLLTQLYNKSGKFVLKRVFDKWKTNANIKGNKLNSIDQGMTKLRAHANRPIVDQMKKLIVKQNKFNRVRAILCNTLRNNDKDNLAYCFNTWKKKSNKIREIYLKAIVLRNLSNKQDQKTDEYKKNKLHGALLRWRIRAVPKDYLQRIERIRLGSRLLKTGMRKPYERQILDGIKERANKRHSLFLLNKLFNALNPKFNQNLLRNNIRKWQSKLGDTTRLRSKFANMLNRYLLSDPVHLKLIREPEQDLITGMESYDHLKRDKAQTIDSFCRGLLNIRRQFDILSRNKFLHDQILNKDISLLSKYDILFKKWIRASRYLQSNGDASIIQKFLRAKINNPADKRKRIVRGGIFLDQAVKKMILNKIAQQAKDNLMKKILKRHINNQDSLNNKVLRDSFTRWRNLLPHLRMDDAAKVIQNNYLNLRARRKGDQMRKLNAKMKYLVLKLFGKYVDKRNSAFNKWLHETQVTKCDSNATIIQLFTSKKLKMLLKGKAMARLHDMFRMSVLKDLHALMKKASKIIGDKGAVMYNTLEDIYIRRPFEKLIIGFQWIGRIAQIKKIKPKINDALRNYFIPKHLQRWKRNTWDDKINKLTQIQRWIRVQMVLNKAKMKQKREELLGKFVTKMIRDNDIKQAIPFKVWNKKTQMDKLNNHASTIQKTWKGSKDRKNINKLLNKNKLGHLFSKSIYGKVIDGLNTANQYSSSLRQRLNSLNSKFENRYATNNLIDLANDLLRNKYLLILTGKRAYFDGLSDLRRKFDKWRRINRISQNAVTQIQNAFRSNLARKKRRNLERLKDRLLHFLMHGIDCDNNRLASGFRRWNLRARFDQCNQMSEVIQDYLTPKLNRLLDKHFQNFFIGLGEKMTVRRLNQGAKVNKLKDAILNINMKTFLQRLSNKDRADRIKFILSRKFHLLDAELLKLYLGKYFNQWKDQSDKLTSKLNGAALLIQRNFKGYLAKLFLAKLKNRKAHLLKILLGLLNDRDLQKQVSFNLWRTNAQPSKNDESSKVIQSFLDDMKNKIELRKKNLRAKRINNGLDKLFNMVEIKRYPFEKIRSESNRKIFEKMNEDLIEKRKDHLRSGLKAIQDKEKDFLLNRLLKIPGALRNKILRKAINTWSDNANKLGRKQGAELIQRNYRLYMERKFRELLNKRIKDILAHLTLKYSDLQRYYFNKWMKNAQKMKLLRAGNKINRFLDKKYNEGKAKKNWHKLSDLLNIKDRNYGALNFMNRLKIYRACQHLIKPIEYRIRKDGFNQLLDQIRRKKLGNKLQLIFNNFERRNEMLTLYEHFKHWKNQAIKLQQRDDALTKAMNSIDNRTKIIAADTINSAFLVKKLFKTIPKIRAIDFYDRLKQNFAAKKKLEDLGKTVVKMQNESLENNKSNLIEKVYKLYIYRIMKKMFNATNQFVLKTVDPAAKREFLVRLVERSNTNALFNYNESRNGTSRCQTIPLSFKSKVTKPKSSLHNDEGVVIKKLIPYFTAYLEKKLKNRKLEALNAIRADYLSEKFCSLFKTYSNKKLLKPKKELCSALVKDTEYKDTMGDKMANLFKLFRKGFIKNLKNNLEAPSRIYKVMYSVRMTVMHKRLARHRYIREVIRKWRFVSFVKKMARKKLELMYKNFHVSYLQMANEVFGDEDDINPSVVKEFERFGSTVGMFSSEEPEQGEEILKKYYKAVNKKYVFEPTVISLQDEVRNEIEEIEENTDFYIDQDLGERTLGKYRTETHKSEMKESSSKKGEEK